MFRVTHILTLVDPAAANPALGHALRWARSYNATVHALAVHVTEGDSLPDAPLAIHPSDAVQEVVRAHADMAPHPVSLRAQCMTAPTVVRGLLRYAERHAIDLIVVPPGQSEWTPSGVPTHRLAALLSPTRPVLLAHPSTGDDEIGSPRRLLAPIDFSRHAQGTLNHAAHVASLYDAPLDVLHVMERPPYVALNTVDMLSLSDATLPERRAERRLQALLDRCRTPLGDARLHVQHGEPAHTIDAFARSHRSGLVVLPTHGTSKPSQRPMGTVAGKLVRRLDTSLLLISSHASSMASSPADSNSDQDTSAS